MRTTRNFANVSQILFCALTLLPIGAVAFEQMPPAAALDSRFEPPFRNEVAPPRPEDAGIVEILKRSAGKRLWRPRLFGLIHGHFLDDAKETVVAVALQKVARGATPITMLFSKDTSGWKLVSRYELLNAAYCRVIPASTTKDLLLCQSDYVGPNGPNAKEEVDTELYSIDFTRGPSDTVATGAPCLCWARVKSMDFRSGSLHVEVEYGRNGLPAAAKMQSGIGSGMPQSKENPAGFSRRLYELEFTLGPGGFSPVESSRKDFEYVTARWDSFQGKPCSASRALMQ